jgi:hypothetical protein
MKAVLRSKTVFAATAGLLFLPALAHAQDASQPATTTNAPANSNTPAPGAVGPRELQNFSLPGTATKPADQSSAPTAAKPPADQPDTTAGDTTAPAAASPRRTAETRSATVATAAPRPLTQAPPATVTAPPPPVATVASVTPQPPVAASPPALGASSTSVPLAAEHGPSILPWILAAVVLAGGTLFLLWRRRPREALADGADFDLFVQPEPAPAPPPAPRAPAPQAAPAPQPTPIPPPGQPATKANGIVASRLRPSLEIGMQPIRCVVDDNEVAIDFEVELFNAGTAPARAIFAEASFLNASATQDQELAAFFAKPTGQGERMDAIPPMRRVTLTSRVVAPRSAVQEYELAGRKTFVPVIAFNALYEWSGGKAQSSLAYLVGRETSTDKLGPLRADAGAREIRGLGARPLPVGVRT